MGLCLYVYDAQGRPPACARWPWRGLGSGGGQQEGGRDGVSAAPLPRERPRLQPAARWSRRGSLHSLTAGLGLLATQRIGEDCRVSCEARGEARGRAVRARRAASCTTVSALVRSGGRRRAATCTGEREREWPYIIMCMCARRGGCARVYVALVAWATATRRRPRTEQRSEETYRK